jgi:hypothetical protein
MMAEELDLTNAHLHSLENVDVHQGLTVSWHSLKGVATISAISCCSPVSAAQAVDLTANRLKEVDPRLLALKGECRNEHCGSDANGRARVMLQTIRASCMGRGAPQGCLPTGGGSSTIFPLPSHSQHPWHTGPHDGFCTRNPPGLAPVPLPSMNPITPPQACAA